MENYIMGQAKCFEDTLTLWVDFVAAGESIAAGKASKRLSG
jgi:hypothetical protein